jgi:hypothetical protein
MRNLIFFAILLIIASCTPALRKSTLEHDCSLRLEKIAEKHKTTLIIPENACHIEDNAPTQ